MTEQQWSKEGEFFRPLYELHPTYDGRGLDEAGRVVRTKPPLFSCSYVICDSVPWVDSVGFWNPEDQIFTYGVEAGEGGFPKTKKQISDALEAASAYLAIWCVIKPPEKKVKALQRIEGVLSGRIYEYDPDTIPDDELPF